MTLRTDSRLEAALRLKHFFFDLSVSRDPKTEKVEFPKNAPSRLKFSRVIGTRRTQPISTAVLRKTRNFDTLQEFVGFHRYCFIKTSTVNYLQSRNFNPIQTTRFPIRVWLKNFENQFIIQFWLTTR